MKNHSAGIGKDAAVLTIAKIITMMISLVSSMLLSRFRTLEEYGTYSQILLVISLASSLFMLGLPNSINYFLARSETSKERQRFLSVYYTLNTVLCLVMGIVLGVSVPIVVSYFNNELIKSFTYVLVLLPWANVTISSINNVLVVYGKTSKLTQFNVVHAGVALFAVVAVKLFGWTFREYMFLYLFGQLIIMVWVYSIVWKLESAIKPLFDKKLIHDIFKYSIPIGLASFVGTLTLEIDKLVIGKLFDTSTLAIYTNAAKELPFTIIATSLTAVLLPQMAKLLKKGESEKAISLWGKTIELSYIIMSFIVTALIVYAPQVMTILYSEKYLPGVGVFRVYSLVLLLRITYFGMVLSAARKTKFILYSSIATLLVNVVLDFLLYMFMGILGPAVATFISIFVSVVAQLIATSRVVKVPFSRIFPWNRIFMHSVLNICWGTAAFFSLKFLNVGTSNLEIIKAVISGIPIVGFYVLIERKNIWKLWKELNEGEKR